MLSSTLWTLVNAPCLQDFDQRVMQYFKTLMGRRICKDPEKPFTNVFLLSQVGQIPVITSFKTYR